MERVWRRDNRLRAHVKVGRAGRQLIIGGNMDRIMTSPYDDRGCYNCDNCQLNTKVKLTQCMVDGSYVSLKCWCPDWKVQNRTYKFEN